MKDARTIQIKSAAADDACSGAEPFALLVLGESMAPEFREGDVIVVEPDALATDGAYVVAFVQGEWIFRRLAANDAGWLLVAEDASYPAMAMKDLNAIRGVVIQRSTPGQRSRNKRYA